jgi:hypothetical protein
VCVCGLFHARDGRTTKARHCASQAAATARPTCPFNLRLPSEAGHCLLACASWRRCAEWPLARPGRQRPGQQRWPHVWLAPGERKVQPALAAGRPSLAAAAVLGEICNKFLLRQAGLRLFARCRSKWPQFSVLLPLARRECKRCDRHHNEEGARCLEVMAAPCRPLASGVKINVSHIVFSV